VVIQFCVLEMGASCSHLDPPLVCSIESGTCSGLTSSSSIQRYKNCKVRGLGGSLRLHCGQVACVIAAFDYEGYPAEELAGCGPLSSVRDGQRIAELASASGADVFAFYDQELPGSLGFPRKAKVLRELKRLGNSFGPEDVVVFFFVGHGAKVKNVSADGTCVETEQLCFAEPNGQPNFMDNGDLARLLLDDFDPETRVLIITDSCQVGGVCDLANPEFEKRPICFISAVRDRQSANGLRDGGAFTTSLLDTLDTIMSESSTEQPKVSVVDVFNACYGKYGEKQDMQQLKFESVSQFDPDTFAWPLLHPTGWNVHTALEKQMRSGGHAVRMPVAMPHLLRDTAPWSSQLAPKAPVANRRPRRGGA